MDPKCVIVTVAKGRTTNEASVHAAPMPSPPENTQVLVRFHFSSVNPLDLAVLSGAYPVKPLFDHDGEPILGFDGVGEVTQVGPSVKALRVGDFVVPARYGVGTWRSHAVMDESLLDLIPEPADLRFGAILRLGVAPAYFLVENMSKLCPRQCIIQNAGSSVIAQMVVQFAGRRGVDVVSIIRDRKEAGPTVEKLIEDRDNTPTATGQSSVILEHELNQAKEGRNFAMAIDSVGGLSAQQMLDCLGPGATFVKHGFLSGLNEVLPVNAASFWARHLTIKSSRSSAEIGALSDDERRALFAWFVDLFNARGLQLPKLGLEEVVLDNNIDQCGEVVKEALRKAKGARPGQRKQLLVWF